MPQSSMMRSRWQRAFHYGMSLLLLLVYFGPAAIQATGGLNWEVNGGNLRGIVIDLDRRGWIWHTLEGELRLGSCSPLSSQDHAIECFRFSVSNPEVAIQLERAQTESREIVLHFRRYMLHGWDKGATEFDVYRVDFPQS